MLTVYKYPVPIEDDFTLDLAGTGHPIEHAPDEIRYIGSAQFRGGSLVFHLFEVLG